MAFWVGNVSAYHDKHAMINTGRCSLINFLVEEAYGLEQDHSKNEVYLLAAVSWILGLSYG